jgi:hypothetical protein
VSDELYQLYGLELGQIVGYEDFLEYVIPEDQIISQQASILF